MTVKDFRELYLAELEELRSVEAQMAAHLGTLAGQATNPTLSQEIEAHQARTVDHRDRLDALLEAHGGRPNGHDDAAMHAIIDESGKWVGMIANGALKDAALIASLQRMEHYEISVFGTLVHWARTLGHDEDAQVLSAILDEDKQTDARLSAIADETVNPAAL